MAFDKDSTEGKKGPAGLEDGLQAFLFLLACFLGFACWIGGSCAISESCFSHEEVDTSIRDIVWLCGGPLIVLISWAVPVFAYRMLGRSLVVLALGLGFVVVFVPLGFSVLAGLVDCH